MTTKTSATRVQLPDADGVWTEERLRQREKNQAAIDLLTEWLNETDPEIIREQRETWEFLKQALDEDRLSYRKLFP